MRTAFEDEDAEPKPEAPKKGLKIDSSKSKFQLKSDSKKDFDAKVKDFVNDKSERNKKAFELGQKFISILSDKTLNSNKGPITKDLEKQVCNDLFSLAVAVNNDPSEAEGAGSLVLDTLFFKSLLMMRDRLNEIEYLLQKNKINDSEKQT
jgi:hypothetical protein